MNVGLPADLHRCVNQGDSARTADLLMAMTPAQRRALTPAFKAILRAADLGPEVGPLLVAGAATLSTAAQVATWIGRSQLLVFRGPWEPIMSVLSARDEVWLTELATRLAAGLRPDGLGHWHLASTLIGLTGAPVPTHDAFVRQWARHTLLGMQPISVSALRSDPFLPTLLPRLFDIDGLGLLLERWDWKQRGDSSASSAIAGALVALSDEGTLNRAVLLDGTLGRLLRGDTPAALRPFVELHRQLRPSVDELAAHQIDYLRLLPDARSFVASMAQAALRTLDNAGRLAFDAIAEASESVLSRPDKALVREQLAWLASIIVRDPARAPDVLPQLALAQTHPDLALAQRARSLIDKYGGTPTKMQPPVAAPPAQLILVPGPADVEPPIRTTAELAADIVALLDGARPGAAITWERVLDGIVRLWAQQPPADVALALAPIAARQPATARRPPGPAEGPLAHLRHTLMRLVDPALWPVDPVRVPVGHGLGRILTARVNELSLQLRRSPVPFLIATPTSTSGHLRPDILVGRMAELEQRNAQPWPYDLDQALLRLPRHIDPAVIERAARLTSPAGARVAQWLARNGITDPPSTRVIVERQYDTWNKPAQPTVVLAKIGHCVQPENAIATAVTGSQPRTNRHRWYPDRDLWPTTLPSHREIVAAHLLPAIADAAQLDLTSCPRLTFLTDATGPLGPAATLALVYGLAAKAADARASAIDTILQLSALNDIDTATVGAEIGTLAATGDVKLNRITTSLDDIARAGGPTIAWDLARAALPALLNPRTPPRGAGEFLQLTARTAAALGARSTVDGLETVTARTGSSQFLTEARRLRRVLTTGELS